MEYSKRGLNLRTESGEFCLNRACSDYEQIGGEFFQ
jgi:hypothetical protein